MSNTVIQVENLSKRYDIGHQYDRNDGLSHRAELAFRNPVRWLRNKVGSTREEIEEFWALRDVSFEINQGDVVGIIGRNGAGKSTILKILSRITEPTSGRVKIKGRVASLLEVGTGFHQELTGRENIFLNGAILGMSHAEIKRKFDEIVAFSEIEKFLDTPVKRYSSGMYVRLAFAVAAHLEPEILIIDEVLAVGDASFQKKCLGKMGEVSGEGRTVLFVSHNIGALNTLCKEAIYFEKGRVKEIGKAARVLSIYSSEIFSTQITDLSSLRVPGFGEKIKFTSIELVSDVAQTVLFGQPIVYSLTIHSDHNLDGLTIGSSLFNNEGRCIGSLITKEAFSMDAHQSLELNLELPNFNLAPGSYYAGFSIGQGGFQNTTRHDLEEVIGKPTFQVVSISAGEQESLNWHPSWGNIVIIQSNLKILTKTT
jgi:lipopolysaccharide transport system ATP-binding protein